MTKGNKKSHSLPLPNYDKIALLSFFGEKKIPSDYEI